MPDEANLTTTKLSTTVSPDKIKDNVTVQREAKSITGPGNANELFPEEEDGWIGYVEWEKYPERKQKAHEILTANKEHFEGVRRDDIVPFLST